MDWGSSITYIAETRFKGHVVRFGIKDADRTHHIGILGKESSDRAAFLANMALEDIARGAGVFVMDGEGNLIQSLLERIPKDAVERLVVLDPSDGEYPYSWNPIDDFRALPPPIAVQTLSETLASVYQCEDGALTTYAATYMLGHGNATLLSLYELVTDLKARERLLPRTTPERADFESVLAASGDVAVSIKEYGQYLGKDTLTRNLIGQSESKFTFASLAAGAIVMVDFSHIKMFPTRITPLSRLILSAARAEASLSPVSTVYLHDCLRYVSEKNLEQALLDRSIALTVSDASQGESDVLREKLLQRAGSIATFVPQEDDVHMTGRAFYPYVAPEELEKLEKGKLIIALAIDSVRSRPFFASVLPIPARSGVSVQDLRLASRGRYTISRLAADKLFKSQKEEGDKKKEDDPGAFSGAFRSIFTKRAGDVPATPKPPEVKPPAAPKPVEKEKLPPSVEGIVKKNTASPAPSGPAEIPRGKLKKMLRVGKPPHS